MSFAYMPLYTGDYLRDTRHLSMAEHGAYLMLLVYCWDQKGPAPLDERQLLGIVNARSTDEIEALRRVLVEFFVRMEDGWYNTRIQREIERMASISLARKSAGWKGYQARAKQLLSKSIAIASTPSPTSYSSLNPIPKKVNNEGERQTALAVLDRLNRLTGKRFKPVAVNLNLILARLHEGFTERDLRVVIALKVQQWRADEKMMQFLTPKTLFNRTNFASYAGSVPAEFKEETDELS